MKFFSKLTARQSTITSLKHWRHFKKTQMFNYCASDHTFILGSRPKERRKKKARDLQLKSYKVVNFTLEQNHLQWQISKAICMRFSWKADDPKFLCLTGSDLPRRTSRFFSAIPLVYCAVTNFTFLSSTTITILEMLFNASGHFINTVPSSIFKGITLGAKLPVENI